jgi:hypothetical protein
MLAPLVALLVAAGGPADAIKAKTVPLNHLKLTNPHHGLSPKNEAAGTSKAYGGKGLGRASSSSLPGIDSLANWSSSFTAAGFDVNGKPQSVWPFTMVGRPPERGDTTVIPAPIIPVFVDLLAPDGSVAVTMDPTGFVEPVRSSPMFLPFRYDSGFTQFNDAMFRAQFADRLRGHGRHDDVEDSDWHTLLFARVKKAQRMQIPFGKWFVGVNSDGSIAFALVDETTFVNNLFPPAFPFDDSTVIGAAELAGDMTTRDLTTLLFNNVYLFDGTPDNCCVLGFHSYDFEPGVPSNGNRDRRYVFDYSSWITPGLFLFGFEDITALSHEIAETFNDPFVDNLVPWWLSQDPFTGAAQCQPVLETGDVVEVLSSLPVYQIDMSGRTYHPQNEATFNWFARQSPSKALRSAYSFPDETTLTDLSPGPLLPGCKPAN